MKKASPSAAVISTELTAAAADDRANYCVETASKKMSATPEPEDEDELSALALLISVHERVANHHHY